jgi:hypothetical protein
MEINNFNCKQIVKSAKKNDITMNTGDFSFNNKCQHCKEKLSAWITTKIGGAETD